MRKFILTFIGVLAASSCLALIGVLAVSSCTPQVCNNPKLDDIPKLEKEAWDKRHNRKVKSSIQLHPPSAPILLDPATKETAWQNYLDSRNEFPKLLSAVKIRISRVNIPDGPYVVTILDAERKKATLWLSGDGLNEEHDVVLITH